MAYKPSIYYPRKIEKTRLHDKDSAIETDFYQTTPTIIWIFFNVVVFYRAYSVIEGKIDK